MELLAMLTKQAELDKERETGTTKLPSCIMLS